MRRRPTITVQPMGSCAPWLPADKAMIRLRGKWVADLFPPYTRLMATLEERRGELVLVLERVPFDESVTLPNGDESLKRESSDLKSQTNQINIDGESVTIKFLSGDPKK